MITRRTFTQGLTGAVTWLASKMARRGVDHELLALRPHWQEALASFNAVLDAKRPIELRYFALCEPHPMPKAFVSGYAYEVELVRVAAANAEVAATTGLDDIERQEADAIDAYHAVVDRIISLPARTTAAICFKAEVSAGFHHTHDELTCSIAAGDPDRFGALTRARGFPRGKICSCLENYLSTDALAGSNGFGDGAAWTTPGLTGVHPHGPLNTLRLMRTVRSQAARRRR